MDELAWKGQFDTQKDWIGHLNKDKMSFYLENPDFILRYFNIVAKGEIELRASSTQIRVKTGLTAVGFIIVLFLTSVITIITTTSILNQSSDDFSYSYIYAIVYLIVGIITITSRLKKTERKLDKLFG